MSGNIITLAPSAYIKKASKSKYLKEADDFIEDLRYKLEEWSLKNTIETKQGIVYKQKLSSFQKMFSSKTNVIIYVVCLSSEDSFRSSIKCLIGHHLNKEETGNIIVISLDGHNFLELADSGIETVVFGNYGLNSKKHQWEILEDAIKERLQNIREQTSSNSSLKSSLTLPIPIPNQKSPSKLKTFFHTFPKKLDPEWKKSSTDALAKNEHDRHFDKHCLNDDLENYHKEEHSLSPLNSLFKRTAGKKKNHVSLGATTSTSTSNGSYRSDSGCIGMPKSLEMEFDTPSDARPSSEESIEMSASSFGKTKNKNKFSYIANCLNNHQQKSRKNHIKTALIDVAHFTSLLIRSSSEMQIKNPKSNNTTPSANHSYQGGTTNNSPGSSYSISKNDGSSKFYSWSADFTKNEELIPMGVSHVKQDLVATAAETVSNSHLHHVECQDDYDVCNNMTYRRFSNDFMEEDDPSSLKCYIGNGDEDQVDPLSNQSDTIAVLPDVPSPRMTMDDSVSFGSQCEDSDVRFNSDTLEFEEYFARDLLSPVSQENDGNSLNGINEMEEVSMTPIDLSISGPGKIPLTFNLESLETDAMKESAHFIDGSLVLSGTTSPSQIENHFHQNRLTSDFDFGSESDVFPIQTGLYETAKAYIQIPIVVGGFFAITALTAPMWRKLIPHGANISGFLTETVKLVLQNDIQKKFLSTASVGTSLTTHSFKKFFFAAANNNVFYHSSKVIFC